MSITYISTTTGERLQTTQAHLTAAGDHLAKLQTDIGQLRRDLEVGTAAVVEAEAALSAMWTCADEAAGGVMEAEQELSYVEDPDDELREMSDEVATLAAYVLDIGRGVRTYDEVRRHAERVEEMWVRA